MTGLIDNLAETNRLLEFHGRIAGKSPGRKYDVEVLNKSAVVLLVACWEAFIEDLAEGSFSSALKSSQDHNQFPPRVLTLASRPLRTAKDDKEVWSLAGDGWKQVLEQHKALILEEFTGQFNTPSSKRIDELFASLLGLKSLSSNWHWHTVYSADARRKLDSLIELRGDIAHRVKSSRSVRKKYVEDSINLIARLSVASHNAIVGYLTRQFSTSAWARYEYS